MCPPLRTRKEDIPLLADYFIAKYKPTGTVEAKELSLESLSFLTAYDWPGNVRELVNTMETCIASTPSEKILFSYHLPSKIRARVTRAAFTKDDSERQILNKQPDPQKPLPTFRDAMAETEKQYLLSLYSQADGNIEHMCRISGISRAVLYRKLKFHSF